MGSRYPSHKVLDYCQFPVLISKNGVSNYVPCGKCDGCLLHSSNLWSQRVAMEIDSSAFSIFFTLTYSNVYLPKLKVSYEMDFEGGFTYQYFPIWTNIRKVPRINDDGLVYDTYDERRSDVIYIEDSRFYPVPITNFVPDPPFIAAEFVPYPSKRDIQLWLKNVRKSLNNRFKNESPSFRYYLISELGGTYYRPHVHGIIFTENRSWADYLKNYALYACWQMCDPVRFSEYCTYCDSSTSRYLTEYVTVPSDLPGIYKYPSTKNFRLVSKSPAIGFRGFEKAEVQEKISVGDIFYDRKISRLGQSFVLRYPSRYIASLFPKCRGFGSMSFDRLYSVYGYLYQAVHRFGADYSVLYERLHDVDPLTFNAQRSCLRFCEEQQSDARFHYVFLLDQYYYQVEMSRLSEWYKWQSLQDDIYICLSSYHNIVDYLMFYKEKSSVFDKVYDIGSMSISFITYLPYDIQLMSFRGFIGKVNAAVRNLHPEEYDFECSDILKDASKMRDYNELIGVSPSIV